MRTLIQKLQHKILGMHMSLKISLIYMLGSCILFLGCIFIFERVNQGEQVRYKKNVIVQSADTVKNTINSMIDTIQYNSKIMIPNLEIQNLLRSGESSVLDVRKVVKNNSVWISSLPFVESLYLFNLKGNHYGSDRDYFKYFSSIENITEAEWYKDVEKEQGYYILRHNGDYVMNKKEGENTVSFLRIINDIWTFKPLGVLMINISGEAIDDSYRELARDNDMIFYIIDENDEVISQNGNIKYTKIKDKIDKTIIAKKNVYVNDNTQYVVSSTYMEEIGWKIITMIPLKDKFNSGLSNKFAFSTILMLIFFTFLLSFYLILQYITRPIERMVKVINADTGNIQKMEIDVPKGELTVLKNAYNKMADRNSQLIDTIYQEQKRKRKAELNVLHEQIKPHFLYNTLDAMQYLALTKQNDSLYDALEALGGFYRMSLSKGREVISVNEEIEIVNDYIKLQKLRYDDMINCKIDVDDSVKKYHVLKLILQPLVENSIYHGIIPSMKPGMIQIKVYLDGSWIVMEVIDNGMGMNQDELNRIMRFSIEDNKNSFGLRGTIERIKIFYENQFIYNVESKCEETKIIIKVPIMTKEKC